MVFLVFSREQAHFNNDNDENEDDDQADNQGDDEEDDYDDDDDDENDNNSKLVWSYNAAQTWNAKVCSHFAGL